MSDISVKMGVSGLAQFKQAMTQAQASVKTYDAQMKLAEAQLKATGNAEQAMQTKTEALRGKLEAQRKVVASAEQALKSMKQSGVDPASTAFQNMQQKMLQAQAAVLTTENDIQDLGTESLDAAGKTDKLANSLGGLNRKVSLDQVISAVGKVTDGIANATKKAIDLGKALWENIVDTARYSDDIATQAMQTGLSVEDFQRYKGVFDTVGELTVQEWMKAKQKVQQAIYNPSGDQETILSLLGISTHEMVPGKYGIIEGAARNFEDVFWQIGQTLKAKVESGELTPDLADTYAQAIFGKGFASLKGLFELGPEGFAAALDQQTVASEEAVNANAELNDSTVNLENSVKALKEEILGGLAPALTDATNSINELLKNVMEWLKKPEGQKALEDLGKAVEGLFSDLGKIDPEQVAQGFADVFGGIVDSVKWLSDNWQGVKLAIEGIGAAFVGLKVGQGVLTIIKLIDGLKGLTGGEGKKLAQAVNDAAGAGGGTSAVSAASGGVLTGIGNWLTQTGANIGSFLGGIGSTALSVYGDWFTHNTDIGRALTGNETWQDVGNAMNEWVEGVRNNFESFGEDWAGVFQNITDWAQGLLHPNGTDLNPEGKSAEDYLAALEAFGKGVEGLLDNIDNPAFEALYNKMPQDLSDKLEAYYNQLRDGLTTPLDLVNDQDFVKTMDEYFQQLKASGTEPEVPAIIDPDFLKLAQDLNNANMHVPVSVDLIFPRLPTFGTGTPQHANGLPYVPFDGYMAVLHKGERVMPAREAEGNRSYSSNLYVESMYMNNGMDAQALAASIAAANRRTMRGFGS